MLDVRHPSLLRPAGWLGVAIAVMLGAGFLLLPRRASTPRVPTGSLSLPARPPVWESGRTAERRTAAELPQRPAMSGAVAGGDAAGNPTRSPMESMWGGAGGDGAFDRFREWIQRYESAAEDGRAALLAEGTRLAVERREDLRGLIRSDPRMALQRAIPEWVRRHLPPPIVAQLERRVSGRGDLTVYAGLGVPGSEGPATVVFRTAEVGGVTYEAYVYGRREGQGSLAGVALHGIALDGAMAVDEASLRILEPEAAAEALGLAMDPVCGVGRVPVGGEAGAVALSDGRQVIWACSSVHASELEARAAGDEEGGSGGARDGYRLQSARTEGTKRLLFMRVDFSDLQGEPFSLQTGTNLVRNLDAFYAAGSFGRTGFFPLGEGSTVTKVLRMPEPAAAYTSDRYAAARNHARAAAEAAGYVLKDYDLDLTCMGAVPGFKFAGLGIVGGAGAWIRASFSESGGVIAHELGHNYGLNHASFWDTGGTSILGAGKAEEYGDIFDTMGSSTAGRRHFNARYKSLLNWIPAEGVQLVSTSGVYRLTAHDEPGALGIRALRFPRDSATNFWVEYRSLFTNFPASAQGVGIRVARSGNQSSLLLDMTPGSDGAKNDSSLMIGRTYSDRVSGWNVTPVRMLDTVPPSIEVVVQRGPVVSNRPPVVRLDAVETNINTGTRLALVVQSSDPDSDTLAYAWDVNEEAIPTNGPAISQAWTSAGDRVVRCRVSDTRGGTASISTVIRVGRVSSFRITGRVLRNGLPVENAVVRIPGIRRTHTDGEGAYTLVGLTRGSYDVQASLDELVLLRAGGGSGPVAVGGSDVAGVDFLASTLTELESAPLVPAGSEWKYRDDGTDLGNAWRVVDADDAGWSRGPAPLGYGDAGLGTTIGFGGDAAAKHVTSYFRREFEVPDPSRVVTLVLGLMRDDGAVVYLNGTEIHRSNMPTGAITAATLASDSVGSADETTFFETEIAPARLRAGRNVLAVEIHQQSRGSSDLRFDLRMTGYLRAPPVVLVPPPLVARRVEGGIQLGWAGSGPWLLQRATRLTSPADWQVVEVPLVVGDDGTTAEIPMGSEERRYFRLAAP